MIQPFDPDADTMLLTDASRLYGIGFALIQQKGKSYSLIQCGSCSLTPTQKRYATIELECMAIQWGVKKCEFYLRGLPFFKVITDHKPLVGIFKKQLNVLENARLTRMREKLTGYSFEVSWVAGKSHLIADALSRFPIFQPQEEELTIDCAVSCLRTTESSALQAINEKRGEEYTTLIREIEAGSKLSRLPLDNPARRFKSLEDRISIHEAVSYTHLTLPTILLV